VKPRLIVVGPLPPPYHGVTVSTALVLAGRPLQQAFRVEHLDTSDHRGGSNIGRWDPTNIALALRSVWELRRRLRGDRGIVYLPLSQNVPGFLRDSLLIHLAAARGWNVAGHLRGSEMRHFYLRQPRPIRAWIRLTLGRLASVAVLGSALRSVFEGLLPPERIAVVPNGTPDPGVGDLPHDGEGGLYMGNLRRRKGVIEAMEAALLVVREHPSARFTFAGEWESPALERKLRSRARDADGRIQFRAVLTGAAQRSLLASSAFFVFPPVEPEGHPRVVLEALATGLPVVTTDRGAIAETVVDGDCGFVLDDPVPERLADCMLALLRDRALRERMGRRARARYLERFTQETADERLASWLERTASAA
jgi:glycosyltransferase involved in cell wall biosynthesis